MEHDPKIAAGAFELPGPVQAVESHDVGHIHDSYIVTCGTPRGPRRFFLQRINHRVFHDPALLMENVLRVAEHIRTKARDPERETLTVVLAADSKPCHRADDGSWWRMYVFIEGTRTIESPDSPQQARLMARAFGLIQQRLADFPAPRLHETIPLFHHTPTRLAAFEDAASKDPCQRAQDAEEEIAFAMARRDLARTLVDMEARGSLPERIAHNDAKINNVLLEEDTGLPLCVVDLDTVMPGIAVLDFADLVRTATSPTVEDETDIGKVEMRMPMFEALARGYLETAGSFLSAVEINQLVTASQVIAYETGMRFLTDYLQGDVYFKSSRERHNLDRCRTQFKLLESMEVQEAEMHRVIRRMI
ncbi:MAG TPA: aminoglycoside phosphotransferase family protein [Kiritimatiellia bacterium]|jgi:Ser/Thr protein kinase RdoA (MazF antagonist)